MKRLVPLHAFSARRDSLQGGTSHEVEPTRLPTWGVVEECPCGQPRCTTAVFVQYVGNGTWLLPKGWSCQPDPFVSDAWRICDGDGTAHRLWAREG